MVTRTGAHKRAAGPLSAAERRLALLFCCQPSSIRHDEHRSRRISWWQRCVAVVAGG
jgi:hypothetical protein